MKQLVAILHQTIQIQFHFYFYHEDEGGTAAAAAAAAPAAFLASNLPLQALRDARVFF